MDCGRWLMNFEYIYTVISICSTGWNKKWGSWRESCRRADRASRSCAVTFVIWPTVNTVCALKSLCSDMQMNCCKTSESSDLFLLVLALVIWVDVRSRCLTFTDVCVYIYQTYGCFLLNTLIVFCLLCIDCIVWLLNLNYANPSWNIIYYNFNN